LCQAEKRNEKRLPIEAWHIVVTSGRSKTVVFTFHYKTYTFQKRCSSRRYNIILYYRLNIYILQGHLVVAWFNVLFNICLGIPTHKKASFLSVHLM